MSANTKPISRKQQVLIALIIAVLVVLVGGVIFGQTESDTTSSASERDACLHQGGVWDESGQRCYGSEA